MFYIFWWFFMGNIFYDLWFKMPYSTNNKATYILFPKTFLKVNFTWFTPSNTITVQNNNHWYDQYFWTYLLVRVLLDILRASSLMLFEGAVVSIIKQHGGDYGLQKLFGTFGAIIFGPLSGILIDFGHGATAYNGVIIMYFVLRTLTAICVLKLNLGFKVSKYLCR